MSYVDDPGRDARYRPREDRGYDDYDRAPPRRGTDRDSDRRRPDKPYPNTYDANDSRPRAARPGGRGSYGEGSDGSPRGPKNDKRSPPTGRDAGIPPPPVGNHRSRPPSDEELAGAGRDVRRRPASDDRYAEPPRDYRRRYPDDEPPRDSRRPRDKYDSVDDKPPRRRDRDPYGRDEDPIRPRRRASPGPGHHEDSDHEAPRGAARPRLARRTRDDDGHDSDRGHHSSDRPSRGSHDRGYRTDDGGRDPPRRDRRRADPPRDREGDRDRYREKDRRRPKDRYDDEGSRRNSGTGSHKGDLKGMVESGQKYWNKAEPVAAPLLKTLAKAYLEGKK